MGPYIVSYNVLQLVDYYTDGQHCDETDGTRSSDVHIQCCNGLHVNSINKDTVTSVTQKNQPHARLNGAPNPPNINEVHYTTLHYTTLHCLVVVGREAEVFLCMNIYIPILLAPKHSSHARQ